MSELSALVLKKGEDRRLRAGHLWIFSNEVDVQRTPLQNFSAGEPVRVEAADGRLLGCGYVNPHSLICARLVSRDLRHPLDKSLLVHRLNIALALRQRLYPHPWYRLVHGEGDALPGLVIDRFNDIIVVQINTAGMEQQREAIVAALEQVLKPRVILLRNDTSARALEGLERYSECVVGELPDQVVIEENGCRFEAPLAQGQKTGWFYDHRENRAFANRLVAGARVLDLFSYVGGWGVQAAVAGAAEVVAVDSSEPALAQAQFNAMRNGVGDRFRTLAGDAFEVLRQLRADQERFDVVIADPPAFIKRKKDMKTGVAAYRRLNQAAMQLLGRHGILISASCSYHLPAAELRQLLNQSARHVDRRLQLLWQGHQAPDHPIHPAIPETDYLKCLVSRLVLD